MRIEVFRTAEDVAAAVAELLITEVQRDPAIVLGLPTGRTPVLSYERLVAKRHRVSFRQVRTFNLDEFVGLGADHPGSYRRFMERHLFAHVDVLPAHIGFLDGAAADTQAECERYERAIAGAGGIGLQLLGIGNNGHIGFNEPAPELAARTHRVVLLPETRRANAADFGGDPDQVPREALSMGMATILHARRIVLLATGAGKAACVQRMAEGSLTTMLPASFLQVHPNVDVLLDEPAAARLGRR